MGNVIQRLTRRGGEFQIIQVEEAKQNATPQIKISDANSTDLPQDVIEIEPNEGDVLCLLFLFRLTCLPTKYLFKIINNSNIYKRTLYIIIDYQN